MVKLYEGGAYLVHGTEIVPEDDSAKVTAFYSGSTQHFRRYGQIKNPFRCHDFP